MKKYEDSVMLSKNRVSIQTLYKYAYNPKLAFNTSGKNFYTKDKIPKRFKTEIEGFLRDDLFIDMMENPEYTWVSIDVNSLLLAETYSELNMNVFKDKFNNDEQFNAAIKKEILAHGLNTIREETALRHIFGTWSNYCFERFRENIGKPLICSMCNIDNRNLDVKITDSKFSEDKDVNYYYLPVIFRTLTFGYYYLWTPKEPITAFSDMKKIEYVRKLRGADFSNIYFFFVPYGFNEDQIRHIIKMIYSIYPKYGKYHINQLKEDSNG